MPSERALTRGETVPWAIHALLDQQPEVAISDIQQRTGLTRQAIQYHLKNLVEGGELQPVGAGRGRRYRRPLLLFRMYERDGLQEDRVWDEIRSQVSQLEGLGRNADAIARFAFTEMLNNAIDHSGSEVVRVSVAQPRKRIEFSIVDEGIGAWENVRRHFQLEDHVAAIQEISKGKMTTDARRHSGQGIFFTSKAVEWFSLSGNGWTWFVDNAREDESLGRCDVRIGTTVRFDVDPDTERDLKLVFDAYTDPDTFAFNKSRTTVRLFEYEVPFVSRSEAKRLARNLEKFDEVIVDFTGLDQVGQGFADELFRVWQRDHRETNLVPINMERPVEILVERARAELIAES